MCGASFGFVSSTLMLWFIALKQKTHILCVWHVSEDRLSTISSPRSLGWRGNILWLQRREAGLTVTLRSATGSTPAPNLCHKRCDRLRDRCQVSVSTFYLYVCLQLCVATMFLVRVKVTCLLFISWEKLLLSLTEGFVHRPEGRGAAFPPPQTLLLKHERKPHGFTLREKTGEKKRKRHNDGIKDSVDPNGGDHPSSGEKRRKLLPQLQGQFTHRDQSSVNGSGGFYRSFFFYSGESHGAQWVESDAEVSGFISHRDRAEEPSHTWGCF